MRNKILMIIAMYAVIIMMSGIATADYSVKIDHSPLLISGSGDSSTLTYGDLVSGNTFYTVRTNNAAISVKACTSPCDDAVSSTSTGWVNSQSFSATAFYTSTPNLVTIHAKGSADGKVFIHINSGNSYVSGGDEDEALATARTSIPEFPTVALPVAALIGLVFFFQQRKKKEE